MSLETGRRALLLDSPYDLRKESQSGVANVILRLQRPLQSLGYDVFLSGPYIRDRENNAADYITGRTVPLLHLGTKHRSKAVRRATAERTLRHAKADIVVNHEPFGAHSAHPFVSAARRMPPEERPAFVGHFHAYAESLDWLTAFLKFSGQYWIWRLQFENGIPGRTDGYINTVNNDLAGRIAPANVTIRLWQGVAPGEYRKIPNPIDTDFFRPNPSGLEKEKETFDLLYAGRVPEDRKNVSRLLEAFAIAVKDYPNMRLSLTANEHDKGMRKINRRIKRLGIRQFIEFLGVLPNDGLARAYQKADVFISIPTHGEAFGITLGEAAASGKMVIASNIDGYKEFIGGQSFAGMVSPTDPETIAQAIMKLYNLPIERRRERERAGPLFIQRTCSVPVVARLTDQYLEESYAKHRDRLRLAPSARIFP